MSVTISTTNKPLNPRAQDLSPKGYNRASLYSGKALDFDGVNDYVQVGKSNSIDIGTSDFSVAFIMESSVAGYGRIADKRDGSNGYTLSIDTNKKLVLELNVGTGNLGFATSTTYADGKIKQVVVSADRDGNANFYINGVLDESIDISSRAGNLTSTSDLFIGTDAPTGTGLPYNGNIYGIRLFNTTLTAAQVSDLYLNPEKIVPDGVANSALKLWLPMMEGAGTTAYDGSGNGNHGTINGATWVSGVGAPVAQTALVGWNKGTNLVLYSEQFDNGYWSKGTGVSVVANNSTAPNGTRTADTVTFTSGGTGQFLRAGITLTGGTSYAISVYARLVSGNSTLSFDIQNAESTSFTVTSSWQRFSWVVTPSATRTWFDFQLSGAGGGVVEFWGAQITATSTVQPYVETLATAQTSPVLLPQGLTANKDITGVNSFENPRNAYALNLDGASWAEVHDNASLDFGTGSFTLEAWVEAAFENTGSSLNVVLNLGGNISSAGATGILVGPAYKLTAVYNNLYTDSNQILTLGEWYHLVATYDGVNNNLYINGVFDKNIARAAANISNALVKEIGRDSTTARTYKGQLALPRIYNRALTATEVSRNYNADKSKFGL